MNDRILKIIVFFLLSSSLVFAKQCPVPKDAVCLMFSPAAIKLGVQIAFIKNFPNQVVYLDMGCDIKTHKFTPQEVSYDQNIPGGDKSLIFVYCVGNELINKTTVEIDSDSKVICSVDKQITCKNY